MIGLLGVRCRKSASVLWVVVLLQSVVESRLPIGEPSLVVAVAVARHAGSRPPLDSSRPPRLKKALPSPLLRIEIYGSATMLS